MVHALERAPYRRSSNRLPSIESPTSDVVTETWQFFWSIEFWRMSVLWTLSLIYSYAVLFLQSFLSLLIPWRKNQSQSAKFFTSTGLNSRPICIVTGATSGLGAATALALSKHGFFVVLAARSPHLLSKTIQKMKDQNKDALVKAFQVDLSSFESIVNFRNSLEQWLQKSEMHPSVQLLINNAGILATSLRFTSEGYDQVMATNYIGPFCLTKLLLPLMKNSPIPSRVVNVTSFTHRSVLDVQVNKETVPGKHFSKFTHYPFASSYEYSKLCLLLFSYELNRRLLLGESHHLTVNVADPGVVKTNIMREVPICLSSMAFTVLNFLGLLQSPQDGISSILDAIFAPPETSGVYFFGGNGRTLNSSRLSYNLELAELLWNTSCNLFFESRLRSSSSLD